MRKAFTLIELLVVIFIIGLLASLVLPAVQWSREAARVSQCANRQRNLALALQTYENARGGLPGWRDYITMTTPQGDEVAAQASWIFCILPHIEQGDLFEFLKTGQIRNSNDIPGISILLCPSNGDAATGTSRRTSYVVNGGAVDDFSDKDPLVTTDGNIANGPFLDRCWIVADGIDPCQCGNSRCRHNANLGKYNKAVARLADISAMDGTSCTLLTSENLQRGYWIAPQLTHFYHKADGTPVTVPDAGYRQLSDGRWIPTLTGQEDTIEGSVAFCWPRFYHRASFTHQIAYPNNGEGARYRGFNYGTAANDSEPVGPFESALNNAGFDTARIPCFLNQYRRKEFSSWYQSARPASNHAGIVVVSFCDGSIRRLNEKTDESLFVQLMTAGDVQSDAGWRLGGGETNFLEGKLFNPGTMFDR